MKQGVENSGEIFNRFAEMARTKTPFFADIWDRTSEKFGERWVEEFSNNIVQLFGRDDETLWESALRGYAEFALDAMRNQKYFEANRRYRWSTLKDIRERYYDNEKHMMENYLPGMFLSHFLWPHHFKLLTFFRTQVLASLSTPPMLFYDVGIGTGIYSREVLRYFPKVRGRGFDISQYSIAFTRRVLEASDVANRYDFVLSNIFTAQLPAERADFLVSQEVVEHLEEPGRFIGILYQLVKEGGRAYITAAINAAHSDHIYLFHSPDEFRNMLEIAGWKILQSQAEYAYTGVPIEITPCVAGFLCER